MDANEFDTEFYENGFVVLRDCVDKSILAGAKDIFTEIISARLGHHIDFREGFLELLQTDRQYDIQNMLYRGLFHDDFPLKILRSPGVLEKFVRLLGPDLSYEQNSELIANVKGVKDDYLVKKWHQEYWSGAGIHTVLIWFPISISEGMGGVEFIPGSHHWGHIPHRNREPLEIPDSAETVAPEIEEGDGIIFHSMTLHRSVNNEKEYPRIAIPLCVKNFYYPDTGVPEFCSWRPFNFSPLALVHKKLGNPQFSPFRTLGSARTDTSVAHLL